MKKLFFLLLLLSQSIYCITPYYSIRSQSENTALELVGAGWNTNINLCGINKYNGVFSIIPEYSKTFRPYYISECLFGNNYDFPPCVECTNACNPCTNKKLRGIRITGSQVDSRGTCDWLADYFGLPTDYSSCVSFEPYIENFLVDLSLYLGLDALAQGFYVKIHAPITHTRWDLNCCECMEESIEGCGRYERKGSNPYWPGYFSNSVITPTIGIPRDYLVYSFESFMCQCDIIRDANIVFNPICAGRMCCQRLAKTGLSDIQMALGWNFLCNKDYHCGLNFCASAPSGTRPEGYYLFEPIIGNGKHWECGGGITAHWKFWNTCIHDDHEESLALYMNARITHLFNTRQCRTFDLSCKPLSRYMLAAKFDEPVNNLQAGPDSSSLSIPSKQFQGIYAPVANLTRCAVDVSVDVQADVSLMLQYSAGNFSADLGYNFWGKSCEKIKLDCSCSPFEKNTWALKGDAFMYGFSYNSTSTLGAATALSETQKNATICSGTNNWPDGIGSSARAQNPGIDNKQLAWDSSDNPLIIYDALSSTTAQVYTSKDPLFINSDDIDINSARAEGMSHKIFAHFDYTWKNKTGVIPYIGIGGEVEFGGHCNTACCSRTLKSLSTCAMPPTNCCCKTDNTCCCSCAVSQWGIWLKSGIAFR